MRLVAASSNLRRVPPITFHQPAVAVRLCQSREANADGGMNIVRATLQDSSRVFTIHIDLWTAHEAKQPLLHHIGLFCNMQTTHTQLSGDQVFQCLRGTGKSKQSTFQRHIGWVILMPDLGPYIIGQRTRPHFEKAAQKSGSLGPAWQTPGTAWLHSEYLLLSQMECVSIHFHLC